VKGGIGKRRVGNPETHVSVQKDSLSQLSVVVATGRSKDTRPS